MILGLLGGVVVLLAILAFAYALSLAMTFWFISIPAIIIWFFWYNKHYHRVQANIKRNMTPYEKANQERYAASLQAHNDMYKRAREREKALRKN